jgi:hypothetical protein
MENHIKECQIRRRLFEIGILVTIFVRRIIFTTASGCPCKTIFATAHRVVLNSTAAASIANLLLHQVGQSTYLQP